MFPIRDVNPTRARPIVTWAIIIGCAVVYFAIQPRGGSADEIDFMYRRAAVACELSTGQALDPTEIQSGLDEDPADVCSDAPSAPVFPGKNIWLAAGVSMFLHGSIAHLLFNMWSLWIFGNNVEEAFGPFAYLLFYVASGVAATAGFVLTNPHSTVPLVGASGAIAGVMGAYLVLFPRHLVLTWVVVWIVGIPAVFFLGIWFLSQFLLGDPSVAWQAHVAGFVFGALVAALLRRRLLANTLNPLPPLQMATGGTRR